MLPRLSLCLVVRDAAQDLRRTLASFEGQLHDLRALPAEVVVVDGDSRDGSGQLAADWATRSGLAFSGHRQRPRGIYPAMNLAWQQASGTWLLFINAGDLLLDVRPLAGLLEAADRDGIDSVQCVAAIFPPGCNWAAVPSQPPMACHQALVYRRCLHQTLGPYDERLGVCSDLLLIRALEQGRHRRDYKLLAATQVSPANASRTPQRVSHDLERLRRLRIPLQPWPSPRRTMFVLRLEKLLGVSITVWTRLAIAYLRGRGHLIRLPADLV